jgi:hypothetical protein
MGNPVRTVGPSAAPNDRGSPPTIWHQIDWRKAERTVQNLRFRIFRAAQEQRWKQVRNLTNVYRRSTGRWTSYDGRDGGFLSHPWHEPHRGRER